MNLRVPVLIAALLAIATAYAATALNVKPGLWEVTYTTKVDGMMMPKSVLDQMPPERRAQVEAAMRQRAARPPVPHVVKSCITPKDLERGAFKPDPDGDCHQTIVSQTSTHIETTLACMTDGAPRTGRMIVDAASNDRMTGSVEIVTPGGKANIQLSGKWLDTSCAGAE